MAALAVTLHAWNGNPPAVPEAQLIEGRAGARKLLQAANKITYLLSVQMLLLLLLLLLLLPMVVVIIGRLQRDTLFIRQSPYHAQVHVPRRPWRAAVGVLGPWR
jgi:hypothetical protein